MDDNITYRDRKVWSDLWIKIYDRIEFLRTNGDYRSYKRAVIGLVNRLYHKERTKTVEFMESRGIDIMDYTIYDIDLLSIFIQDLLEDAGYIKYNKKEVETGMED